MTQQAAAVRVPSGTQAGMVDTDTSALERAGATVAAARRALLDERRRAHVDRSSQQQQRVEDAQRDLDAAESFEAALDDGQL